MGEELRDYLTAKELEQLDSLIRKAEERRKEEGKEEEGESEKCFLLLKCQCDCAKAMAKEGTLKEEFDLMNDLEKTLQRLCSYCMDHGCRCISREVHSDDKEELPFES